ncbi:MAG TPA: hypothetical protein IAC41_08085 [Candidatus Merdenecus merdavium]|nr:hypothetical protein [Candidatus Merdenecus merdavium]
MKKAKVLAMALVSVLTLAIMVGCGNTSKETGSKDGETVSEKETSGKYTYNYNVATSGDEVQKVPYNFAGNGQLAGMMRALDTELKLDGDGNFTMTAHGYIVEDTEGSTTPVGKPFEFGNGMYAEFTSTGEGTYVEDGDTVTATFTKADFEIPDMGASYLAQLFSNSNARGGSYAPEGDSYYGKWSSEDVPEVLEQFPVTVFTLKEDKIVTWDKGGKLTEAKGEQAFIKFYNDGTAYYEDSEAAVSQDMNWEATADGVTLTYMDSVAGQIVATVAADEEVEISINIYSSATDSTTVSQKITVSTDNIAALQ